MGEDKKIEENDNKNEKAEKEKEVGQKEDPPPLPEIREIIPPSLPPLSPPLATHQKRRKQSTILKAKIPGLLAFAMCWPTNVEVRRGDPERRHRESGLYIVKRSAGGRHSSKAYIAPAPEKPAKNVKFSSPSHSTSSVTIRNEQHVHQRCENERKQEEPREEKTLEKAADKLERIKELERELEILREVVDKKEVQVVPEDSTIPAMKRRSPYRISVPGRYHGEVTYVENEEFDYVVRSPKVKFTD